MRLHKLSKRALGALTAGALVAALGASAASATSGATGTNGFTQVTQTRVFDSTRIAGDPLLASGHSQQIDPNAITKGLVPSGATAVEIQITAAQETEVNGDLDVTPTQNSHPGTSNLNFNKGVAVTSSTVATLGPDGTFWIYNHGGGAGNLRLIVDILGYYAPTAVYTPPTTLTADASKSLPETIATGGSAVTKAPSSVNATDVVELTFPAAGTYQVSVNAKATPLTPTTGAEVFPQFFVYNGAINPAPTTGNWWDNDLFNVGSGALESGPNTNIDSYFSGSSLVTVTAGEELHIYAFGYDSDRGAGSYTLDSLSVVAVPVTPAS